MKLDCEAIEWPCMCTESIIHSIIWISEHDCTNKHGSVSCKQATYQLHLAPINQIKFQSHQQKEFHRMVRLQLIRSRTKNKKASNIAILHDNSRGILHKSYKGCWSKEFGYEDAVWEGGEASQSHREWRLAKDRCGNCGW